MSACLDRDSDRLRLAACLRRTWLCSPHSENLNGREVYINGGHVALVQEPEFVRSQFAIEGWTLEGLCGEATSRALTWDIRNRFTGARAV